MIANAALRTASKASTDPLGFAIRSSRMTGAAFLIAGFGMGAAGWYVQAAATTAQNNEMGIVTNLGAIFSNIKPITFTPAATGTAPVLGPNPVQDALNFYSDAKRDVQAISSDLSQIGGVLGTLGEDVAMAIVDIAKSILAFVLHFPDILWNGMIWGIGGAIANVLLFLFPYFIVVGAALMAISFMLEGVRWGWGTFITPGIEIAEADLQERVRARWTRLLIHKAPAPPEALPEPIPATFEPVSNVEPVTEEPPIQKEAPEAVEEVKEAPAEVPKVEEAPAPPPEETVPVPTGSTEETEAILGGVPPPGWTQEQFDSYMKAAPKPEKPRGRDIAVIAAQLLSAEA